MAKNLCLHLWQNASQWRSIRSRFGLLKNRVITSFLPKSMEETSVKSQQSLARKVSKCARRKHLQSYFKWKSARYLWIKLCWISSLRGSSQYRVLIIRQRSTIQSKVKKSLILSIQTGWSGLIVQDNKQWLPRRLLSKPKKLSIWWTTDVNTCIR